MKRKEEKEDGKEDILSTSSKHKSRKVAVSNAKRRVSSDVIQQVKDDADFEKLLKETSDDKNCVSIVFVYATWSTPCKQILPIYQALIKKLHTESVSSLKSDLKTVESKDESESATIQDPATIATAATAATDETKEKSIEFRFYKVDTDTGPKSITAKSPVFVIYRNGNLLCEVRTQGKGLEKKLASLELEE